MDTQISPDTKTAILSAVNENFGKQVEFIEQLIRFPSIRGKEGDIQKFLETELRRRDYQIDVFEMDHLAISQHSGASAITAEHSASPIVVATHLPVATKGRSLILQGHVDVVPTGPDGAWTYSPFEARIDGDWCYGRGGGDMKAGHAAMLGALDALRQAGYQPAAKVLYQSVVEEESTGHGALMCHIKGYTADAVLIAEPTGERLVRANVGVIWFKIRVEGVPTHVHRSGEGQNAIESALAIITALRALEMNWISKAPDHNGFVAMGNAVNLNVGRISGGDWASSVPSWCEIECRIGIYPGEDPSDKFREIEAAVADAASKLAFLASTPPQVTINGFRTKGFILAPGSSAERTLERAHQNVTGSALQDYVLPAYLDARVYALYGEMAALTYGPYAENIHGFDERFSLASLQRSTAVLALFIAEWCGLESIKDFQENH